MKGKPVFLAHIGAHHLFRLAEALAASGLLAHFVTGICMRAKGGAGARTGRIARLRVDVGDTPITRAWTLGLLSFLPQRLFPERLRTSWNHRLWWRFASRAANVYGEHAPRIAVGFENSALDLFRAAKAHGEARCVLECPSVHFSRQSYGELDDAGRRLVALIEERKREEIALADHIVVLSRFAKRTFVEAGVPKDKLEVIPLGVDAGFFDMQPMPEVAGGVRFLFAGTASYGKGIDVLVEAFRKLAGAPELRFVGVTTPLLMSLCEGLDRCTIVGPVDRQRMRAEFARAHVVVLPSRFDGFGMVVTEAMATGRPVIVTDHVGAADVVRTGGVDQSGWVVRSENIAEMQAAMQAAIDRREHLAGMGAAARKAVDQLSWDRYRETIAAFYRRIDQESIER